MTAAAMSSAWIAFARSGNPSRRKLTWPAYDTAKRETLIFDVDSHAVADPDGEVRQVLAE